MSLDTILILVAVFALLILSVFWRYGIARFCFFTPLKVIFWGLPFSLLLWAISTKFVDLYQWNEYFEPKGMEMIVYPFIINIYSGLASYSIFLNKLKIVRDSWLFSLISFLFLPFLAVCYFASVPYWKSGTGITGLTFFLPFFYSLGTFALLLYFYLRFRRSSRKSK